jgi:hypothetical protein
VHTTAKIARSTCITKISSPHWQRQPVLFSNVWLELCSENGRLVFSSVVSNGFRSFILPVTATDITVWTISALLAVGIGWSKYAKWKTRDKLVRELAAMDPERREKVLSRMQPELAMEARQELMRRFYIS